MASAGLRLCRHTVTTPHARWPARYCFLNNAAIAAESIVRATGRAVAILDVDYHHGNGTQQHLLAPRRRAVRLAPCRSAAPSTRSSSGNADETGEGEGSGANLNLPLPGGDGRR